MVENVGIHRKDLKHKSMNQVSVTIVQYFDREHRMCRAAWQKLHLGPLWCYYGQTARLKIC